MSPAVLIAVAAFSCAVVLILVAALAGAATRGDELTTQAHAKKFSDDWWDFYEESEAS